MKKKWRVNFYTLYMNGTPNLDDGCLEYRFYLMAFFAGLKYLGKPSKGVKKFDLERVYYKKGLGKYFYQVDESGERI